MERRLWRALRLLKHDGLHFRRQAPIGPYIADFACHRAKIVVELDGSQHAESKQAKHDAKRTKFLESIGYQVIRFWNFESFKQEYEIARYIYSLATPPTRRAARADLPSLGEVKLNSGAETSDSKTSKASTTPSR